MTVDLRGAMRSIATEVCVMTTYLDEAAGRRHDGPMILDVGAADIAREFAKSSQPGESRTNISNGRSVVTGQPSLITNRCYKEYM